jgi:hypothetical protein
MSLSFPANPTNGQEYTDSNGKVWEYDGVKWNIATSESSKQFSGVKVLLTSPASLVDTDTTIEFDTEEYDTATYFVQSTPTTVVIPRTGYYRINLQVQTGTGGAGNSYSVTLNRNESPLFNDDMAPNQAGTYDDTLLLNVGDTLQLSANEANSQGTLILGTSLEVQLVGYSFGGSIVPGFEFSGVKVDLFSNVSTTATPTAITWTASDIVYNLNANAAGSLYWSNSTPTRFTISTTGYYRIKAFFLTGPNGAEDSYIINVRKNGTTTIDSASLSPAGTAELDETYQFNSTDYVEVLVSNNGAVGTIESSDTTFAITRLGV